jgi:glycosyltransferase involved in cell wall biosynthesis
MTPPSSAQRHKPRLLLVVTEDWYFLSHRLPLARAALAAGYTVAVATRVGERAGDITAAGLDLLPLQAMRRRDIGPVSVARSVAELKSVYRRWAPDIVHHVAMKPIICGGVAARQAGIKRVVNAVAGFGYVFSSNTVRARLLRPVVRLALRSVLRQPGSLAILQNRADATRLAVEGLIDERNVRLVRGSGVDLERFVPRAAPPGPPVVMLCARLLWDKGIREFVAAAQALKAQGFQARFVLVGDGDPENPACIAQADVERWQREGAIEWWGRSNDMATTWAQASIACLPSYAEGLPKVLIEAAACGLPAVTTDVPGCCEAVTDNVNGLLVPPRDAEALAAAIARLLADASLRQHLGAAARLRARAEFGEQVIAAQTLAVYQELLAQ